MMKSGRSSGMSAELRRAAEAGMKDYGSYGIYRSWLVRRGV